MKLAVIGSGKMGQAIARGLVDHGILPPSRLCGVSPVPTDREAFAALSPAAPLETHASIPPALDGATVVLIAVKPQQYAAIASELQAAPREACFLSIMAGIPLDKLEHTLGTGRPIIRCMPNTPLLVGEGAVAWSPNRFVDDDALELPEKIFGSVGLVLRVEEPQLDAVTALSGSGPAFFFRFMQSLTEAAIEEGLPPDAARALAAQTAIGTGALLRASDEPIETLIANVRSKGGTTEAGLHELEGGTGTFDLLVRETVRAAARRSRELAAS